MLGTGDLTEEKMPRGEKKESLTALQGRSKERWGEEKRTLSRKRRKYNCPYTIPKAKTNREAEGGKTRVAKKLLIVQPSK